MPDPLISVIVVNLNGKNFIGDCLGSLRRQTFPDFETILVDNGSSDGSVEYLRENFGGFIRLLRNEKNEGFAGGNNRGIRMARGKYVALLNNDARVDPSWLEELVKAAEEDPRVGMVAPKIYLDGLPGVIDNVGHLLYRDGLNRGRGRLEVDHGQFDTPGEILFPSGCAALYRRAMLDEIGLFDEDFFAYGDDTDIGLKGRLAGWKGLYVPTAVVYHRYSQSSGAYSPLKAFYAERNRVWVAVKYFPLPALLLSPGYTLYRFLLQGYGALSGKGAAGKFSRQYSSFRLIGILFRAYISAARGLPKMWRKRKEVQKITRVGKKEVMGWFKKFGISTREIALKD